VREETDPTVEVPGAGGSDSGGCSISSGARPAGLLLLVVPAAFLLRRRLTGRRRG
jgi:hypothetical protein